MSYAVNLAPVVRGAPGIEPLIDAIRAAGESGDQKARARQVTLIQQLLEMQAYAGGLQLDHALEQDRKLPMQTGSRYHRWVTQTITDDRPVMLQVRKGLLGTNPDI